MYQGRDIHVKLQWPWWTSFISYVQFLLNNVLKRGWWRYIHYRWFECYKRYFPQGLSKGPCCSIYTLHSLAAGKLSPYVTDKMFHNPTAAVNLFHVGKQYLAFCKAEAAVTHDLIGRKIISNVKRSDVLMHVTQLTSHFRRHTLKSQTPQHTQCVRVLQMNATSNDRCLLYAYIRARSAISLSDGI